MFMIVILSRNLTVWSHIDNYEGGTEFIPFTIGHKSVGARGNVQIDEKTSWSSNIQSID